MVDDLSAPVANLLAAVTRHSQTLGLDAARNCASQAQPLINWLGYLHANTQADPQRILLTGTQAAVVEVVACVSLGLLRPALFSLRAQLEMTLAWIYFKDHPREWNHAQRHAGEAKLRGELIKYFGVYYPRFKERFKLLSDNRKRMNEEPYNTLSAHVHSVSAATAPGNVRLEAVVADPARFAECAQLQGDVAEYLNDIFLSCWPDKWPDLPDTIRDPLKLRLSNAQQKALLHP